MRNTTINRSCCNSQKVLVAVLLLCTGKGYMWQNGSRSTLRRWYFVISRNMCMTYYGRSKLIQRIHTSSCRDTASSSAITPNTKCTKPTPNTWRCGQRRNRCPWPRLPVAMPKFNRFAAQYAAAVTIWQISPSIAMQSMKPGVWAARCLLGTPWADAGISSSRVFLFVWLAVFCVSAGS